MKKKRKEQQVLPSRKRGKGGHEKTRAGICLICFNAYAAKPKTTYRFSRYNVSTMNCHMKTHKDIPITDYDRYFVLDNDSKAVKAVKEYAKSSGMADLLLIILLLSSFIIKEDLN